MKPVTSSVSHTLTSAVTHLCGETELQAGESALCDITAGGGLDSQLTHRTFKALTCSSEGEPRQAESCSEPRCWSAEEQLSAPITLTSSSTFKTAANSD